MKFTLSWLKEHLQTEASVDEIAHTLTMVGLEIESVEDRGKDLADFVAARVVEARQHPNADRLSVCTVDSGAHTVDVVCGAPNARTGMIGVFAPTGSYIPGTGISLKKSKIRGVESNGMLLSERELSLSDDHEGIIELPADSPVGAPAARVMGLDDTLFDIAVTPNRGDCLGVRGVARDLAAAGLGTLKPLDGAPVSGGFDSPISVTLDLDSERADACPYFVGRFVRGLNNGESPRWLKDRLLSVGLRPISALVDITNYVTIGLCRPLHVFDADHVGGDLHVRMGRPGETIEALNGRTYEIDGEMTVIADDHGAEALGGVMGGQRTGCTETTVNVMVEAALFDPLRTAATGRKLNLTSDARYRFERGVDPSFLTDGMEIATRLIIELCGGKASHLVVAGAPPPAAATLTLRPARVRELGGVEVADADIRRILGDLGFGVAADGDANRVTTPPWRNDIVGEACLVEEVVRIHGYDQVPAVPLERSSTLPTAAISPGQRRRADARRTLAGRGLVEAVTYSFVGEAEADLFGGVPDSLRLVNPISSELNVMRPSILPGLIIALGRNADRGFADAALFEIGPQYAGDRPQDQAMVAAAVRGGQAAPRHWAAASRPVDAFDAKADALAVLGRLGLPVGALQTSTDAPPWYHPGRSAGLRLDPRRVLAWFGEIHPRVLRRLGVRGPMSAVEILLDNLPEPRDGKGTARPALTLSAFQPVERDFAFVVGAEVAAEAVVRAARGADKDLIIEVRVFDVFTCEALGVNRKSLAIGVVLQPKDRTLTDQEIDAVSARVVERVTKATGGELRQ